ncbi:nog-1 [Scenedesmus sp. PABB004]|nr:nog-1 [Scenedesmus sp. PABB004]
MLARRGCCRCWRLAAAAAAGGPPARALCSGGTSGAPLRTHRRQLSKLERAAAIGLAALQQQEAAARGAAARPAAAGGGGPGPGGGGSPLPGGPLPAVSSLEQLQLLAPARARKRVGALQRLPVIPPADELAASALKRALRVQPAAGVKNEAERERSRAAKQLDTHMKELSVPLGRFVRSFPSAAGLHPFEAALLDLTVGAATYASVLAKVDALRKALQETGKGYANRAANAANKRAAAALAEEGSAALGALFDRGAKAMEDLKRVSRALRGLPYVDPSLPTLALVGAPNVGKSSLVRALSSGVPEVRGAPAQRLATTPRRSNDQVCNYPFTTRSIKMGHFYVDAARHQVTDTPGLLRREDEHRNAMELLTLAALQHLPSSVMFVADLTEDCGTSVADQWAIRAELRRRFPAKPWVDVLSKADMLGAVWAAADGLQAQAAASGSSSSNGGGGSSGGSSQPGSEASSVLAAPPEVQDAVEYATALPGAVRVSTLDEAGLPDLQRALVAMLASPEAAAKAAAGAALLGGAGTDGAAAPA